MRKGEVTDISFINKLLGYGCEEEAIRIIKLMPNWIPAQKNNKPISDEIAIPIEFKLK
ncbi:energy transducer TonB [Flavobacteriales bacterium]|nr:energy transducer TonB [Flavobacteriales bacterium]